MWMARKQQSYILWTLIKELKCPTATLFIFNKILIMNHLVDVSIQQVCQLSAPFLLLSGFWCVHLHFLRSGDGRKDGRPGNLWPQMLPRGHVEPTGLLYRHGRVSASVSYRFEDVSVLGCHIISRLWLTWLKSSESLAYRLNNMRGASV